MPSNRQDPTPIRGQTVVITGASDGIGRAAARALVIAGAHVVMIGRNEAKTAAAARALMSETGSRTVTWDIADLSRTEAVRELAARLSVRYPQIHVLINNAGAVFMEHQRTADGIERTFALNHLAYFSLSLLLLDSLAAASEPGHPARIIAVSSRAHKAARLTLRDVQLDQRFRGWRAYANSKLANLLMVRSLAARLNPAIITVHAVHPGLVRSRFATNNGFRGRLLRRLWKRFSIAPAEGADTLAWLTMAPINEIGNGHYWVRRQRTLPSLQAQTDELAEGLWNISEVLTGLHADALIAQSGAGVVA